MRIAVGFFVLWCIIHVASLLSGFYICRLASKPAREFAQRVVALIFSLAVSLLAASILTSEDVGKLASDLTASTQRSELTVSMSLGFFMWDVAAEILDPIRGSTDPMMLTHGVMCLIAMFSAMQPAPVLHHIVLLVLTWEFGSVFNNIRYIMLILQCNKSGVFFAVQVAFALSYLLLRIALGIPMCAMAWLRVYTAVRAPNAQELCGGAIVTCQLFLVFIVLSNVLNVIWARAIVKKVVDTFRGKPRRN
jgi:hypothetical protein